MSIGDNSSKTVDSGFGPVKIRRRPPLRTHLKRNYQTVRENYIAKSFGETSIEFCRETSLHGFKLIFDVVDMAGNIYMKRFFQLFNFITWIFVIIMGTVFGIYLMLLVWTRFQTTPTITTVETNNYPIWNVAFPGVTICNVNTVYKPNTARVTEELVKKGFAQDRIDYFYRNLMNLIKFREVESQFLQIFAALEEIGYTTQKLMMELAQPCERFLKDCQWLGKPVECRLIFRMVKSAEGFCCSFNYKALRTSLEISTKWDDVFQIDTPVIRVSGAGEDVGLRVTLDVESEHYVAPKRYFYGADILIHDPEEYPEAEVITAVGQPGFEVAIAVTPSVVVTDDSVTTLPLALRLCRFNEEKPLRITKKYSFASCMTECKVDTILKYCKCLPFTLPDLYEQNSSVNPRQCTLHDVKCLSDNKHIFSSLQPPSEMLDYYNQTLVGMDCDCVPSCTEKSYHAQTYIAKRFDNEQIGPIYFTGLNGDGITTNLTLVKVYFRDLTCIKYRREVYLTWDGVLASFGGIFGLCLGGSVISLIELAYFYSFKFFSKIFKNRAQSKIEENRAYNNKDVLLLNFNKTKFQPQSMTLKKTQQNIGEFIW